MTDTRTDIFVVGLDGARAARRLRFASNAQIFSACVTGTAAVLIALLARTLADSAGWVPAGLLQLVPALIFAIWTAFSIRLAFMFRRNAAALSSLDGAFEISAWGIRFPDLLSRTWVGARWDLIQQATRTGSMLQPILAFRLVPGLTPDHPGLLGTDDPKVWKRLRSRRAGGPGMRFATAMLVRPLATIDGALRYYSGGRTGIG